MANNINYGCIHPDPTTKEYPVAATQYFYRWGVNAVKLSALGQVILATTGDATVFGIAIVPKGRGAGASDDYWLSSATSAADKIPVLRVGDGYEFFLPSDATVTAGDKGNACDLISVNDGTATQVDIGTSSTDIFLIQDLATNVMANAAATDVIVKINPAKVQADT